MLHPCRQKGDAEFPSLENVTLNPICLLGALHSPTSGLQTKADYTCHIHLETESNMTELN